MERIYIFRTNLGRAVPHLGHLVFVLLELQVQFGDLLLDGL
jgi:hypothetical protein